jgi:hypothetical protein
MTDVMFGEEDALYHNTHKKSHHRKSDHKHEYSKVLFETLPDPKCKDRCMYFMGDICDVCGHIRLGTILWGACGKGREDVRSEYPDMSMYLISDWRADEVIRKID